MSTKATADSVKAIIDTMAANAKAQIDALDFSADPPPVVIDPPKFSYAPLSLTAGTAMIPVKPINSGGVTTAFSGTLPDGLLLDGATGTISGTPKTAKVATGYTISASNAGGIFSFLVTITVSAPVVVVPPTNPGGTTSGPLSYSGKSGMTISGLSIDSAGGSVNQIYLTGCNNIHITMCRFSHNNGISIWLNNCNNITIDNNFFTFVGFGVYAQNCGANIVVQNNQGLNRWNPTQYNKNVAHWVQFNGVNGAGCRINSNKFEDVEGQAVHPHDHITVYGSNGTAADPIQMTGNWLRGGQLAAWPDAGSTGGGIMPGDVSGSNQICQNNLIVNAGCAGIQCIGSATGIVIDGNKIFQKAGNPVSMNGIDLNTGIPPIILSNNRVNYTNKWGHNQLLPDGEPGYWLGGKSSLPNVKMINNVWYDPTITEAILPAQIITYK